MPQAGQGPRSDRWHHRLRPLLLLCAVLAVAGCKAELYSRLAEREANLIIATLMRNGITADRVEAKDGTSTVRVEQERFADAVLLLNAAGLPRAKFQTMGDIFSSEGLVSSPTEERARFIHALNQELAKTITEIDGVISARVHVVLPKNDPLRHDQAPSAASVFIKYDARAQVTALLPQIKTLIANSVEGLTYDKVAVVFVRGDAEPLEPPQTTTIEAAAVSGAPLGGRTAEVATPLPVTAGLGAVAALALMGAGGFFWLWRRAREGAALGRRRADRGNRVPLRAPEIT